MLGIDIQEIKLTQHDLNIFILGSSVALLSIEIELELCQATIDAAGGQTK